MLRLTVFTLLLLAIFAIAAATVSAELFDPNKCHLVDYMPQSRAFLFRGNQPSIKKSDGKETFAYSEVYNTMVAKAASQANVTLPPSSKLYIVDISFEWPFESGQIPSMEFFAKNPNLGRYEEWIIVGDVIAPADVSPADRDAMLRNGTIWKIDKIPSRLLALRQMMEAGPPAGYEAIAFLGHCAGGCDRTGEFMMSYQMQYSPRFVNGRFPGNFSALYDQDCTMNYGCGRCSNAFGSGGASWSCLYFNMYNATKAGVPPYPDCMTAFKCKPFGDCEPTN